jgi:N-acyl-D-aspartate/D-glutamate deacylase
VLDAVIQHAPDNAERAIMVLINGAHEDIERVVSTRKKIPSVSGSSERLRKVA